MLRIFVLLSLFFAALFADLKVVNENELTQMQNKNVVVIDIRTLGEWKEYGIIENAKPITFFDEKGNYDITKWLSEFSKYVKDKNQAFVIYCAHRQRPDRRLWRGQLLAGPARRRVSHSGLITQSLDQGGVERLSRLILNPMPCTRHSGPAVPLTTQHLHGTLHLG